MATGAKLAGSLRLHPLGLPVCLLFAALVFGAIAIARLPLGYVLLVAGGAACFWTGARLK